MTEPTDDEILSAFGLSRDDVDIRESRHNDVLVQTTATPNFTVSFIRLQEGFRPAASLRGEAHVDIAEDGSIIGVTVQVWKR